MNSPKELELTASDEILVHENMETLRQNGFDIDTEGSSTSDSGRRRLRLVAQPVSKSTVFDVKGRPSRILSCGTTDWENEDLEELLDLLRDCQQGQMVRCSKARAMFAMRACRKSVMVGMPLKMQQMTSVSARPMT